MNTRAIFDLFETAISHDLKYPKIRLQTDAGRVVVLKLNGAKSKYQGSIAVTDDRPFGEGSYFGRIERNGGFLPSRDSDVSVCRLLDALSANPAEVAAKYGRLTGACCFCQQTLTDARSTSVGYGPICADHFGLPWGSDFVAAHVDAPLFAEAAAVPVEADASPEALLRDASTPFWAADVIRVALTKDAVEAANVLEVIAKAFADRAKQLSSLVEL